MTATKTPLPLYFFCFFTFASTAHAYCYYDDFNRYRCNTLSNAARVGIAVAIAVGFIVLLLALAAVRRRRIQRQNLAFIGRQTAPNPQSTFQAPYSHSYPGPYGPIHGQYANHDPTNAGEYPQPPQLAYYTGQAKHTGYNIEAPPPPSYAPPAGSPPHN